MEPNQQKKPSKQNITRDIEIKMGTKLMVPRGEVGRDNRGKGERVFRNMYKGHMDKTKVGAGIRGGR